MTTSVHTALAWASAHLALVAVTAAAALLLAIAVTRAARKFAGKYSPRADDVLTLAVAAVATAVAVSGMWRFFGVVLHLGGPERAMFCAVLELAAFTEAVRAKRNMTEFGTAGVDGTAMWVLAALSGVLAAWSAGSLAAAAFRFSMPMVAAWLWHRALALARRRATGRVIHWRLTAERILVRLGLADPTEREASEMAAYRRLTVLARAAKRLRLLRASGTKGWRVRWASRRLDGAMVRAVEFADLAGNPARQSALLAQLGALYGAATLADLDAPAPWAPSAAKGASGRASASGRRDHTRAHLGRSRNRIRVQVSDADAEMHFATDLAAGQVPSARRIQRELHVGQERAGFIRQHLQSVLMRT